MRNLIIYCIFLTSCNRYEPRDKEERIFSAGYGGGIGGLGLSLYKDGKYQILNTGGLGGTYYHGSFSLRGDTIILADLDVDCGLTHDRLLIFRNDKNDIQYWKSVTPKYSQWYAIRHLAMSDKSGLVYQVDKHNIVLKEEYPVLNIYEDSLNALNKSLPIYRLKNNF